MKDSEKEAMEAYIAQIESDRKMQIEFNSDLIISFKEYCKTKGLVLTNDNFDYIPTIGMVAEYPDITLHLSDSLSKDKEGLVSCEKLYSCFEKKEFMAGYLYGEKFMVMANPCFSRGMNKVNNYAPRFIDLFWGQDNKNIDSYLSLDYDRVRINVNDSSYLEMDTWYGARFDQDISQIQDGISKLRPPADLEPRFISFLFADSYSMDVKWETKGNIKTFQSAEFKTDGITLDKDGTQYHPVRYIVESNNFSN